MMACPVQAAVVNDGREAPAEARSGRFVQLERAVRAGRASSAGLVKQFGTADPWRLAEALDIRVEWRTRCPDNPRLRSEIINEPATIILYTETLGELSRLLGGRTPRLAAIPLDTIEAAIAIFRYLERVRPELLHDVSRGWPRVARVVAAHAFAEDLLELPFFPAEIDAVDRLCRSPIHLPVRRD